MTELNIQDLDLNVDFNNFDPESIDTEETINAVFVLDVSPSMSQNNAIGELSKAYNEFISEMKNSHLKDRLFFSVIEFAETVEVRNGFQPVTSLNPVNFKTRGRGTALYDATNAGLKNAMEYRSRLENSGVVCKTLIFIITDGEDNASITNPIEIKNSIKKILSEEKNVFSFTSILFGVGDEANFKTAKEYMGIQILPESHQKSAKDIRKLISMISSSISSSANGQAVTF